MDHDNASGLLWVYELDACDQREKAGVAAHLVACAECREELAGIQRASGWLGVSDTALPPGSLRAKILRSAEKDPL